MTYGTAKQRKLRRQEEAGERQARHDALTLEEKLDKALAGGGAHCREYLRLSAQVAS